MSVWVCIYLELGQPYYLYEINLYEMLSPVWADMCWSNNCAPTHFWFLIKYTLKNVCWMNECVIDKWLITLLFFLQYSEFVLSDLSAIFVYNNLIHNSYELSEGSAVKNLILGKARFVPMDKPLTLQEHGQQFSVFWFLLSKLQN